MPVPELQKLCLNCQHFEFEFSHDWGVGGDQAGLTFRCEQDRYDLKGRDLKQGQFLMYMYMGQKCEHFKILDFTGPKGRAGLPSGESFGSGGSIESGPPLGDTAGQQDLKA